MDIIIKSSNYISTYRTNVHFAEILAHVRKLFRHSERVKMPNDAMMDMKRRWMSAG